MGQDEQPHGPRGEMALRTLAMPKDTNPTGDIFGGWILSQMDIASGLLAAEITRGRAVTVAVEGVRFLRPIAVGDTISVYGELVRVGRSSLDLRIEVWRRGLLHTYQEAYEFVTEGMFTYVAIDESGKPRPFPDNPLFFTRP